MAIRSGETEVGIQLYKNSILNAKEIKNDCLENLATVNFTKELLLKDLPEKHHFVSKVRSMTIVDNHIDLVTIRNEVLELASRSGL